MTSLEEFRSYLASARACGTVSHAIMARETAEEIWTKEQLDQMQEDGRLVVGVSGVEIAVPEFCEAGCECVFCG